MFNLFTKEICSINSDLSSTEYTFVKMLNEKDQEVILNLEKFRRRIFNRNEPTNPVDKRLYNKTL